MSLEEAERLRLLLRALPPRNAQALTLRFVDGWAPERCAEFYGISPPAFDVMLLRAARQLAGQPQESSFEAEELQARALAERLEHGHAGPDGVEAVLTRLQELGPELRALMEKADRDEVHSPAFRRETWLRRLFVVLILALTAYFYLSSRQQPPSAPTRPLFDRFQHR